MGIFTAAGSYKLGPETITDYNPLHSKMICMQKAATET